MLPTPSTSHLSFTNIYEPSEDSYLLLDTLSSTSETAFLSTRFQANPPPLILEVGTGSGIVLAFVAANARAIFAKDVMCLGMDVNEFACRGTAETVMRNVKEVEGREGVFLDAVNGSLTSVMREGVVDVLIFNPPYVPSEDIPTVSPGDHQNSAELSRSAAFERDNKLLALATDGGEDGMVVINHLLAQLPEVLSKDRGVSYVLLCAQNKPEEVKRRIRAWGSGWKVETVSTSGKQGGWEKLQVVRIERCAVGG